jgi:hypothetical protein
MQLELKSLDQIEFFNGFTEKDINKNPNAQLKLVNSSLAVVIGGKLAAKVIGGQFGHETFTSKLILFNIKDRKHKHIILEINCNEKEASEMAKLIKRRNVLSNYKDPLKLDYSRKVCDSVLSTSEGPANLRGFFNLFLIFSFLNYSRLIIDHSFKYGSLFSQTVELLDLDLPRQPLGSSLFLLCAAFLRILLCHLLYSENDPFKENSRIHWYDFHHRGFDRLPPAVDGHGHRSTSFLLSAKKSSPGS